MSEGYRFRPEQLDLVRARTDRDRMDFVATELAAAATLAGVAESHYHFGERLQGRHARAQAREAWSQVLAGVDASRQRGHSTAHLDERMENVRARLERLDAADRASGDGRGLNA
jgi:hypothetical protein